MRSKSFTPRSSIFDLSLTCLGFQALGGSVVRLGLGKEQGAIEGLASFPRSWQLLALEKLGWTRRARVMGATDAGEFVSRLLI